MTRLFTGAAAAVTTPFQRTLLTMIALKII